MRDMNTDRREVSQDADWTRSEKWALAPEPRIRAFARAGIRKFQRVFLSGDEFARRLGVKVGKDSRILSYRFGTEPFLIEIGNRVTISSNVTFLTHDGATWLIRDERGRRQYFAPIKIGSDVFVGNSAIIMPGIEIGDRVIVGAGSVVTKSVPSGCIVAGNPARFIRSFDEFVTRPFKSDADREGVTFEQQIRSITSNDRKSFLQVDNSSRR